MKVGIIGLPSTGKSTLFQLLTGAAAPAPGGRPEPRVGIARVPDPRVEALAEMYRPKKKTPATVEYVDVPGVAKGEGAALVDLPALRGVDALVHVVRAFESDVVPHPEGSIDPLRDARMLELELILADLGTVERRLERLEANIKKANKAGGRGRARGLPEAEGGPGGGAAAARARPSPRRSGAAARLLVPLREAAAAGGEPGRGPGPPGRGDPREDGPRRLRRGGPGARGVRGLRAHRGGDGAALGGGRAGLPRGPRASRSPASTA